MTTWPALRKGLSWPLPAEVGEAELESGLFPGEAVAQMAIGQRALPDFVHIHYEVQQHQHTKLQLLWEEYRASHPEGYRYSASVTTISNGSNCAT